MKREENNNLDWPMALQISYKHVSKSRKFEILFITLKQKAISHFGFDYQFSLKNEIESQGRHNFLTRIVNEKNIEICPPCTCFTSLKDTKNPSILF